MDSNFSKMRVFNETSVSHEAITGGEYAETCHTGSDPTRFVPHLLHGIFPMRCEKLASDIVWTMRICNLQRQVAFKQIVSHEFVNGDNDI